jgi:hypothetical protein
VVSNALGIHSGSDESRSSTAGLVPEDYELTGGVEAI